MKPIIWILIIVFILLIIILVIYFVIKRKGDESQTSVYSNWSDWSECDKACGGGTQRRTRTCVGPCNLPLSEEISCNIWDCPPVYSNWSNWSACSGPCNREYRNRTRTCISGNCKSLTDRQVCVTDRCKAEICDRTAAASAQGKQYRILSSDPCRWQYTGMTCPSVVTPSAGPFKGTWLTYADRNFIGRGLCQEPGTKYYGKVPSASRCELKCNMDPNCDYWTWNRGQRAFGVDTLQQCIGGTGTPPDGNLKTWVGFDSGIKVPVPPSYRTLRNFTVRNY